MDRLAVLARHLPGAAAQDAGAPTPSTATATATLVAPAPTAAAAAAAAAAPDLAAFCPKALHRFITPDNFELRESIKAFLKDPLYTPAPYLSLSDFRDLTLARLRDYVTRGRFFSVRDYLADPLRFMACLELLALADYSLCIKAGVHFTLCGGTIARLGSDAHRASLLPGLDSLETPGCFAMTELGHGSNVMGIETTATYDPKTQTFTLHTPTNTASKFWIGGAGQHGKISTVFAQLTTPDGVWRGPHVFAVRIRDDAGGPIPGIRIRDHGAKAGLNGVDNGQIWFDKVRVPRSALLNAHGDVAPDGAYTSPHASVGARFGATVGGLTAGRVLIAQGALEGTKIALAVALRFSADRPQFGEAPILDYITHARRLAPALASTYGYHLAVLRLKALYTKKGGTPADAKAVHVLSSVLKAGATWARCEAQQAARECAGGMGFLAANRIGPYKNDQDVDVTFEGDNTVLMATVARALVDAKAKGLRSGGGAALGPPPPPPLPPGGVGPDPAWLLALARWREDALATELAAALAGATGAAAAAAAWDARLDAAVELGWARADAETLDALVDAAASCPPDARPAMRALAAAHGLARAERAGAALVAAGVLGADGREGLARLRRAANATYTSLTAGGKASPALKLVEGWGIPDHLVGAPIAFDWRKIGEHEGAAPLK